MKISPIIIFFFLHKKQPEGFCFYKICTLGLSKTTKVVLADIWYYSK